MSGNATVEPQEELEEINQEIENQEPENQEIESQEENQEEQPKINTDTPEYKAGMEQMKANMQEAFDRRISKIIGKSKAEINSIREEFGTQLAEIKQSLAPVEPMPKLEDCENEAEWINKCFEWNEKKRTPAKKPTAQPKQQPAYQSEAEAEFAVKEREYEKAHPGYYTRVRNLFPYAKENPAIAEGIFSLDPAVADHLSSNLETVEDLVGLTPAQIGVQLARIESAVKRDKPLPKRAKKQPAPAPDLRGNSVSNNATVGSQQAYNEMRWKLDHPS